MSLRWSFKVSDWTPTLFEVELMSSLIQPEEKERIGRFVFQKDAKSSLIGRLLLRKCVSMSKGLSNNQIQLIRDEHNKPILPPGDNNNVNNNEKLSLNGQLNFNVSHQGDYVVLACEPAACQLGIDVMDVSKPGRISESVDDYFRLMRRTFTNGEWDQINKDKSHPRLVNFTRFWSLKESYVKAIGLGIVIDLRSIDFQTNSTLTSGKTNTDTKLKVNGQWLPDEWIFEERFLDDKHIVAVACERSQLQLESLNGNFVPLEFESLSVPFLIDGVIPLTEPDSGWAHQFMNKKVR